MRHRGLWASIVTAGLLLGCAEQTTAGRGAWPPVPALIPEIAPKPPISAEASIWQPGYWDWTGAGYEWRPGLHVRAPEGGNLWMPGYWDNSTGGWVWRPAHWRS